MKVHIRTAVLAGAAATILMAPAFAQSTVTIFGIADAALRHVKNGSAGSLNSLASGGYQSNRLGFRGTEDLGDGLQAGFWLEHGFSIDTGTMADSARFWNRRTTVSLSSKDYGELRLGRDYTPSYNAMVAADPFLDNGIGGISVLLNGLGSGVLTLTRADNQASYLLPEATSGVFGQVSAAAGENTPGAKYAGAMLGWRNSQIRAVASYAETTITSDKYKLAQVGGSYDFGVVKLSAHVLQARYRSSKQALYFAGAAVPVGLGQIRASFTASDLKGPAVAGQALASADDAHRFALGYFYNLSKRSIVYASAASLKNKSASRLVLPGGPAGLKAGENSRGFEMGLRHAF